MRIRQIISVLWKHSTELNEKVTQANEGIGFISTKLVTVNNDL